MMRADVRSLFHINTARSRQSIPRVSDACLPYVHIYGRSASAAAEQVVLLTWSKAPPSRTVVSLAGNQPELIDKPHE